MTSANFKVRETDVCVFVDECVGVKEREGVNLPTVGVGLGHDVVSPLAIDVDVGECMEDDEEEDSGGFSTG